MLRFLFVVGNVRQAYRACFCFFKQKRMQKHPFIHLLKSKISALQLLSRSDTQTQAHR